MYTIYQVEIANKWINQQTRSFDLFNSMSTSLGFFLMLYSWISFVFIFICNCLSRKIINILFSQKALSAKESFLTDPLDPWIEP